MVRELRAHRRSLRARGPRGTALTLAALTALALTAGAQSPNPARPGLVSFPPTVSFEGREVIAGEALVRFEATTEFALRTRAHDRADAEVLTEILPGLVHVRFTPGRLAEVLASYGVEEHVLFAEPNYTYRPAYLPDDAKYPTQWAPPKMRVDEVWDEQRGDPGIVIAVIDSGVDADHSDLAGHYAWGLDLMANDDDPDDLTGHGTGVAGIAAAVSDNGIGIAGVGFDCSFAAYKVGNGVFSSALIATAIIDARDRGAHVLNMSFYDGSPSAVMEVALGQAELFGMVAVAAAGNDGSALQQFPATFSNVIGVANATDDDERHHSSNLGDWVSVAAPGHMIKSTAVGDSYGNFFGTSMATPNVAGVAALLYAELGGERTPFKAKLIANAIKQTSVPVPGEYVKHGRVDALEALRYVQNPPPPLLATVSKTEIPAWQPPKVNLTGGALDLVTAVRFAGVELAPGEFDILSDTTIRLTPPEPSGLGTQAISCLGPGGWSDPIFVEMVATSPPALLSSPVALGGFPYEWLMAADAGDPYVLVVSLSEDTGLLGGLPALSHAHIVGRGLLNAAGLAEPAVLAPTGMAGVEFFTQFVVLENDTLRPHAASNVVEARFVN